MTACIELTTPRLTLVAVTLAMIEAELGDRAGLALLLGAEVPAGWPPPLNDENTMRWTRDHLAANPDNGGWGTWYFLLRREGARPLLIGNGGFKGHFVAPGTCEVGYSVMETHQRNGYATEFVAALAEWAFAHPEIDRVVAHTLPELLPSIRVLEKNGFTPTAPLEPEAIMFELVRNR
jgi:RimJ/RimL family protein N-acetyltransferase